MSFEGARMGEEAIYCPCGWSCHQRESDSPCSLSCIVHDPRILRANNDRLRAALERIAIGTASLVDPRCQYCGSHIGDTSETPGHRANCPTAIARRSLSPSPAPPAEPAVNPKIEDRTV